MTLVPQPKTWASHGEIGLDVLTMPAQSAESKTADPKSVFELLLQTLQFPTPGDIPDELADQPVLIRLSIARLEVGTRPPALLLADIERH
jgi:hypothetical protein